MNKKIYIFQNKCDTTFMLKASQRGHLFPNNLLKLKTYRMEKKSMTVLEKEKKTAITGPELDRCY